MHGICRNEGTVRLRQFSKVVKSRMKPDLGSLFSLDNKPTVMEMKYHLSSFF